MSTTPEKTHILFIPYPAQGHMIPILDLAHHLANTNLFTITIVTTPKNQAILSPLIAAHPTTVTPLIFPFPAISGIPAGAENTKDLPPASFRPMMFALSRLQDPLRVWFHSLSSTTRPVAIVSDFFMGWTHRFGVELGVKRVVFSPSGAMALSVIYELWKGMFKEEDCDENGDVLFKGVPSLPKYPWWQLSPVFRSYVQGEEISEFIKEGFWSDMESWGLVINTFDELERDYLGHLRGFLGHDRVWAVGPLVLHEEKVGPNNGHEVRGGSSSVEVNDIMSWLDTCRDEEVVYVSFGTQALLTGRQMEVLADALERSGVKFVWPVRDLTMARHVEGDLGEVPQGFEDRVKGRGLVIKGWAPQVPILKHRAVGAFLTHCGWNSVLEGIMAGVALLAWPMGADQFTNATLLVDQLKVGVRVCEGSGSVPDPTELARALANVVSQGLVDRQRIMQLRDNALEVVNANGSSYKDMVRLANSLTELRTRPLD